MMLLATSTSLRGVRIHAFVFGAGDQLRGVPFGVEGVEGLEVHFPLNCNMLGSTVSQIRST